MKRILPIGFPISGAATVLAISASLLVLSSCRQIDSHQLGVKRVWGVVQENPLEPGLHFVFPIVSKVERVTMEFSDLNFVDDEGLTTPISGTTKDGVLIELPVSVGWAINPEHLTLVKSRQPGLYTDREYVIIRAAVRDAISEFTYDEIFDRDRVRAAVERRIRVQTAAYYKGMGFGDREIVFYSQVSLRGYFPTEELRNARMDAKVAPLDAQNAAARTKAPTDRSVEDYTRVMQAQAVAKAVADGTANLTVVQSDNPNVMIMPRTK